MLQYVGKMGALFMEILDSVYDQIVAMLRHSTSELVRERDGARAIANVARWFTVPGGCTLFEQAAPSDAIYVVLSGVLGVSVEETHGPGADGRTDWAGRSCRRDGLHHRSAAIRDCARPAILRIAGDLVDVTSSRIAMKNPAILLVDLPDRGPTSDPDSKGEAPDFQPHTFALLSIGDGVDLRSFGERFKAALGVVGNTFLASRDQCQSMTAHELFQLERSHRYVVYVTEQSNPSWSKLCMRQADTIVVVAKGDRAPQPMPDFKSVISPSIPLVLLLTWEPQRQPTNTMEWIKTTGASRQYHVRRATDLQRVARLLTGSGFGLVLSGGGARGLAHLGVVRALRENGIDIDIVMGTSVGALIGAGIALELDTRSILEHAQQFCGINPLFELTIPRLSLLAGRHLELRCAAGSPICRSKTRRFPYSCVSTNLNSAELAIHQSAISQSGSRPRPRCRGCFRLSWWMV